jgi:glycosyltransferase involved in cell wall biosynthesis
MTPKNPRISIIMPVKNGGKYLKSAIESFVAQDWINKELIIADGNSTDSTIEIIKSFPDAPIVLLTGQDRNATEALNKAANAATGDIVGMLMADDLLPPDALRNVAEVFMAESEVDVVSGRISLLVEQEDDFAPTLTVPDRPMELKWNDLLQAPFAAAFFFSTLLWRRFGGFSEDYQYGADRDLLVRIRLTGSKASTTPHLVYCYRQHAQSSTLVVHDHIVLAFLDDHIQMARRWLAMPDVAAGDRRRISAWAGDQFAELAIRTAKAQGPLQAAIVVRRYGSAQFLATLVRRIGTIGLEYGRRRAGPTTTLCGTAASIDLGTAGPHEKRGPFRLEPKRDVD